MMKRKIGVYTDFALLSALALVPLIWFRDGYGVVAGFDFAVYLNPIDMLEKSMYVWSDRMAGGYDISHEVSSLPYYLMFAAPLYLGASFYNAEKFVFCSIFALQGFAMYFMLSALFHRHGAKRAVALFGAFLYAFSYPVMAHFGRGNMMALLTYGLLPILIGLLYKGFNEQENSRKTIAQIALLSFPIAATKGHPADFVVLVAVAFMFALFHLMTSGARKALRILAFTVAAFAVSILASLWWLVPNLVYLSDFGLDKGDLLGEGFFNLEILSYYSRGTSLLNVLRNERLDLWFDVPQDALFNPAVYQSAFFVAIGLLMPITSMAALLSRRLDKNAFFFAVLFVFAVFMSKGNHEPFGKAFEWLYMNVPGFFFFRAPYRVFSSLVTFALTPLLALAIGGLALKLTAAACDDKGSWFSRAYRRWTLPDGSLRNLALSSIMALGLITFSLYAWPVFTGAHMKERGTVREPGVFHRIPEAYYSAKDWTAEHGKGAKIYYPYETYDANTSWGYNGPDPTFELLETPKAVSRPGGTVYIRYQRPIEALNRVIWDWEYGDLKKLLGLYNIRFLILHEDFNKWVMPFYNFNSYAESLLNRSGIALAVAHGPLKFYENAEYAPKVYGAARAYMLSGDAGALRDLSLTEYAAKPFLLFAKDAGSPEAVFELLDKAGGLIIHNKSLDAAAIELVSGGFNPKMKDAAILPEGTVGHFKSKLVKKLSEDDFESLFLFDEKTLGQGIETEVVGKGSYKASVLRAEKTEREIRNALDGPGQWRIEAVEGEGEFVQTEGRLGIRGKSGFKLRAKREFPLIDAAAYPELVFEKNLDSKKSSIGLSVWMEFRDLNGTTETLGLRDGAIASRNDVMEALRRNHTTASFHRLKEMTLEITLKKEAPMGKMIELELPGLTGEFGVAQKPCGASENAIFINDRKFAAGQRCGEWLEVGEVEPGRASIRSEYDAESLSVIKKTSERKEPARVEFAMINPTRYNIKVSGGAAPNIVFSESFNKGWRLYANGKEYRPLKVNGYANGFIVDEKGPFTGSIEYAPQRVYDYSRIASVFSVIGAVSTALYTRKKGKHEKQR